MGCRTVAGRGVVDGAVYATVVRSAAVERELSLFFTTSEPMPITTSMDSTTTGSFHLSNLRFGGSAVGPGESAAVVAGTGTAPTTARGYVDDVHR